MTPQSEGSEVSFSGLVVRGDQLGRTLGFPTANLDVCGGSLPPRGVYAVYADGHPGVMNVGVRPSVSPLSTASCGRERAEVHLLDFEGDVYGQTLRIVTAGRLRDEQKFGSLADLKSQIARDVAAARALFADLTK